MAIYDSFRFFNELELLEIRFNLLYDVVDYFVITECPYTTMGDKKPLYYLENKERFAKFNDKVIHDVMEEIPTDFTPYLNKQKYHTAYSDIDPYCGRPYIEVPIQYQRDMYARNYTAYSLEKSGIKDDDIVIFSDADEIINPLVLENLKWFDPNNYYLCLQRAFYYNLNTLYQEDWEGSRICTWSKVKDTSFDKIRTSLVNDCYKIQQGGWHWSYFGGVERYRQKMAAGADSQPGLVKEQAIDRVENKLDPLGRGGSYQSVPMDDTFPQYLLENQKNWAEHISPTLPTKFNKVVFDSSDSITEFCNLGALYPTDKSPYNRGRGLDGVAYDKHSYTALYDFIFSPLKYKNINIGELGIDRNNSMIAWRKYFPNATLYGWDLTEDSIQNALKDELENTHYDFMDVRDEQSIIDGLSKPGVKYDILIDDSTHTYEDYIRIVNVAHKFMNIGGILIVEDIRKHILEEDFLRDLPNVRKYFNSITFVETYHKLQGANHNNDKLLFLIRNDVN